MPLVVGMVACLLLLGAGVTAATSGFLARASLQHLCDGAASAAADAAQRAALTSTTIPAEAATTVAADYVAARRGDAHVSLTAGDAAVQLTCTRASAVTFGALFGSPTITLTVRAVGHTVLPPTRA
jgi:hypothetical protein